MELSGKVVVITGGSAGIGRATALEFARRGARVGVIARDLERLEATRKEIEATGTSGAIFSADVADAGAVDAAADHFEKTLGPIDVWVNNAMTAVFASFWDVTPEEYRRVTDVTYHGYVYGTLAALRRMRPRNSGAVIQVGSTLAYRGIPLQSAYCGAKHAIEGFTDSLRAELIAEDSAITVGMVQMPALNTPQFSWVLSRLPKHPQPVPPIYAPEIAAEAIVTMAEHPRREMWVGEPTVLTIPANRLFPGLLDRYLGRTGVDSQQVDLPVSPDRPSNLWEPVPGDYGVRGAFTDQEHIQSPAAWASRHRLSLLAGGSGAAVSTLLGRRLLRRSKKRRE